MAGIVRLRGLQTTFDDSWALQYEGRTLSAGHLGLDGLPAGALPQDSRVAISGSLRGAADPEARALPKYSTT
ncbi:TPA: hypothetical protein ACH3X1_001163 [Trebouxia sp. C0004]